METKLYLTLYEWRTGERQHLDFTANTFLIKAEIELPVIRGLPLWSRVWRWCVPQCWGRS